MPPPCLYQQYQAYPLKAFTFTICFPLCYMFIPIRQRIQRTQLPCVQACVRFELMISNSEADALHTLFTYLLQLHVEMMHGHILYVPDWKNDVLCCDHSVMFFWFKTYLFQKHEIGLDKAKMRQRPLHTHTRHTHFHTQHYQR